MQQYQLVKRFCSDLEERLQHIQAQVQEDSVSSLLAAQSYCAKTVGDFVHRYYKWVGAAPTLTPLVPDLCQAIWSDIQQLQTQLQNHLTAYGQAQQHDINRMAYNLLARKMGSEAHHHWRWVSIQCKRRDPCRYILCPK